MTICLCQHCIYGMEVISIAVLSPVTAQSVRVFSNPSVI